MTASLLLTIKQWIRAILRRGGFEVVHRTGDPVLRELRMMHETLRFVPQEDLRWDDSLPQLAAHAHLRHLLATQRIDLVVDVEANCGQFARLVRTLGFTGDIVSFEPLARFQNELRAAADDDGRWRFLSVALGRTPGECDLHVYQDHTFSSLHQINAAGQDRFTNLVTELRVERVSVRTLDQLWLALGGDDSRRVLLKTDTQGHDLEVLAGAVGVLQRTHAVVTEASFRPIYDDTSGFFVLAEWLRTHGFSPSGLFPNSHRQEDLALIEIDAFFTKSDA